MQLVYAGHCSEEVQYPGGAVLQGADDRQPHAGCAQVLPDSGDRGGK